MQLFIQRVYAQDGNLNNNGRVYAQDCNLNNNGVIHPETICAAADFTTYRVYEYRKKKLTSSSCGSDYMS